MHKLVSNLIERVADKEVASIFRELDKPLGYYERIVADADPIKSLRRTIRAYWRDDDLLPEIDGGESQQRIL